MCSQNNNENDYWAGGNDLCEEIQRSLISIALLNYDQEVRGIITEYKYLNGENRKHETLSPLKLVGVLSLTSMGPGFYIEGEKWRGMMLCSKMYKGKME